MKAGLLRSERHGPRSSGSWSSGGWTTRCPSTRRRSGGARKPVRRPRSRPWFFRSLDTRGQSAYGENLAFNPWHALPEHKPVGSIALARKVVYQTSAEARRDVNAIPIGEPVEPRPVEWSPGVPYPPGKDEAVVRAKSHPAIGIARVGNSDEWFVAPEVTEPGPPGFYRDDQRRLKRQAARFRVYGYNAAGEVVRELTAGLASLTWTVHVANRKSA